MSFRFVHEAAVRWSDIDVAGVVNNAVYLTLLEEARYAYFGRLGLREESPASFLLGETSIRFVKPVTAVVTLAIAARISRLGGKSLGMEYEVRRDGEVVATARATLVWVDGSLRSCEIPDAARRRIAEFEGIPPRA